MVASYLKVKQRNTSDNRATSFLPAPIPTPYHPYTNQPIHNLTLNMNHTLII